MQDISGQGLSINIVASVTFPIGFTITQFTDDVDPLDLTDIQLGEVTMGLNGDMIFTANANPIPMVTAVIPSSEDDQNLNILGEANRVGKGKKSARDIITASIVYPDGRITTLTAGKMTNMPPDDSVTSSGRKKSKTYAFAFENKS